MRDSLSALQHELNPQQKAFMAQLLAEESAHADDVEVELGIVEYEVGEVGLILPPGCRSTQEMHDNIERRLIWLPGDAAEPG